MAKKSGNFFEQNIDKIVLAVMGLVCLAILAMMVVRSPNTVTLDGRSYGPGEIDTAISNKVVDLEAKLSAPAQARSYTSKFNDFKSMYASAVSVPQGSRLPLPAPIPEKPPFYVGPYSEPAVPKPARPIAGIVSGVAPIPLGSSVEMGSEPGDVDLVTLQSSFNAAVFYKLMADAFKEPALQTPLFAAVELQRQEMNEDGSWPEDVWQTIKRTKVDPYVDILDIEKIKSMPVSEAEALRTQLMAGPVAINVLQPVPYDFMSRAGLWLPPEYEEERAKSEARQAMLGGGMVGGEGAAVPAVGTRPPPTGSRTAGGPGMETEGRTGRPPAPGTRQPQQPTRTPPGPVPGRPPMPGGVGDVGTLTPEQKFEAARITNIDLLGTMQQVVFWTHDDTVQPGKTYRYRLRLGVLNPVAGRGRSTTNPELAQKLVFWSEFTGEKEQHPVVDVPARMYLFPSKLREADNMVTVDVAKYSMARWERKQFEVRPGEMIGRLEKMPPVRDSTGNFVTLPDVDFSTGITLLDVEAVTEYRPNSPTPVTYQQILYRDADGAIRNLPIKVWPKTLAMRNREIDNAIRNQPIVPVVYTSAGAGSSYSAPGLPSMPTMPGGGGMREEY